jgi:hypothetical protein
MTVEINKKQAREIALAIRPHISDYIKEHEAEYHAYLLASVSKQKKEDISINGRKKNVCS